MSIPRPSQVDCASFNVSAQCLSQSQVLSQNARDAVPTSVLVRPHIERDLQKPA